jgi:MFS family permease
MPKTKDINEEKIHSHTKNQSFYLVNQVSEYEDDFGVGVKHHEKYNPGKVKMIHVISFLMGFSQAILLYVISTYFKEAAGTENVGLFYLVSYAITLIIFFNLHKIIKRIGKSNSFLFSLLIKIITIIVLLNFSPSLITIFVMIAYIISGNLEWLSLDIIIESFSADAVSGRIRGRNLTILNTGLLLGPFVSTSLLAKFDFSGVFLALFIFNAAIFIAALVILRDANHKFEGNLTIKDIFIKIIKRKNILRIYYISFVLEFFYALMIIYTPIYFRNLGISWEQIGYIFTIMLIPFILVQYPMGLLADKKFGEKEFIVLSLAMMAISTLIIYFITSTDVLVWSLVLFSTRIGAALIEVLRDSYFFKRIDAGDVDIIDFFRTAQSSAYILASAISVIVLVLFPVKAIFPIIALIVFSALYPAIRLEDNKCESEILAEKRH